jgi:MFS family permease
MNPSSLSVPAIASPWWRSMNRYHWFVLIVAALGWLFDCLDQQLFNIARAPAMKDLLAPGLNPKAYAGYATSIFLIGWATGGLIFGVVGDRFGRARTMMITILIYSLCTGLSALSKGFWDFAFYRFITGLGVGGEFAVGVALIAESVPAVARPHALALLQALSAAGNITAALISILLGHLEASGVGGNLMGMAAWRWMFVIGAFPALLVVFIQRKLKEPEAWVKMKAAGIASGIQAGSYGALFANPTWRKNTFIGVLLACSGVIGLWGIGFFAIDLQRSILEKTFRAEGLSGSQLNGALMRWSGYASLMINIGAFFGMLTFGKIAHKMGRRPAFAMAFIAALFSTALVFLKLETRGDFWMLIVMGFCQLSLFAGYAIYFPELFPTSLRSTGTSFCYNVGRFIAAGGPTVLGLLTSQVFKAQAEPMRYAGLTMCSIFILGLLVLPFAPETKDQPLPEDERGFAH